VDELRGQIVTFSRPAWPIPPRSTLREKARFDPGFSVRPAELDEPIYLLPLRRQFS
jgi:hypothetical protein